MSDPTPVHPTSVQPAPLFPRFLARLMDALIVGLPLGIVLGIVFAFAGIADETIGGVLMSAISLVAIVSYHVYFESKEGQTPGKQVFRVRVTGPTGGVPTPEQALKRNAWVLLGVLSAVPGAQLISGLAQVGAILGIVVTVAGDEENRGWHDKFADTRVLVDA